MVKSMLEASLRKSLANSTSDRGIQNHPLRSSLGGLMRVSTYSLYQSYKGAKLGCSGVVMSDLVKFSSDREYNAG